MTLLCPFRLPVSVFNVMDYGAHCDGTDTSDHVLAAVAAADIGAIVYFPPGTYTMDHTHIQKQVILRGAAPVGGVWGSKIKLKDSPTGTTQLWRLDGAGATHITIQYLEFDLSNTSSVDSAYTGVYPIGAPYTTIHDCYFHGNNCVSGLPNAVFFDEGSDYSVVRDCTFDDCHEAVAVMASSYCQVLDNVCTNINRADNAGHADEAIFVRGSIGNEDLSAHNYIAGNSVTNCTGAAYYVIFGNNNTFYNNTSVNCLGGIYCHNDAEAGSCAGNVFDLNTFTGGALGTGYGILCSNNAASNTFSNNHIIDYATAIYGISIPSSAGTGNVFSGNHMSGSKQFRVGKACTITGNEIETAVGTAVYVDTAMSGLVFSTNNVHDAYYTGLQIAAAVTNLTMAGNTFQSNNTSQAGSQYGINIATACVTATITGNHSHGTYQTKGINVASGSTGTYDATNDMTGNIESPNWDGLTAV